MECFSSAGGSLSSPPLIATPLMKLEENFEEELAAPGEEFDTFESTLHAQLPKDSSPRDAVDDTPFEHADVSISATAAHG